MNQKQFIELLNKDNVNHDDKIKVCQYVIDNYPVQITSRKPTFLPSPPEKTWTKLQGISITSGSELIVDKAFKQLVDAKKELENFKF